MAEPIAAFAAYNVAAEQPKSKIPKVKKHKSKSNLQSITDESPIKIKRKKLSPKNATKINENPSSIETANKSEKPKENGIKKVKEKRHAQIKLRPKDPRKSLSYFVSKKNKRNKKNTSLNRTKSSKTDFTQQNESLNLTLQRNLTADSIKSGKEIFGWIIDPIPVADFMSANWEKRPQLIQRKCPEYYADLLSTTAFYQMLCDNRVEYTKNLDITSYKNGVRETLNPEGRALPPAVRDLYEDGCSLRLLNPQTFLPKIYSMNATLQEYFQCMTGANVYMTPPHSQGFAPHYDDIEAFVLQVEGRKHWKLYKPRSDNEYLPRFSSKNFAQDEIGEPILDVILSAGDLLYFPRGTIHQATTVPGIHSLHITLSVYQKQSFADLLEVLMPLALQKAITSDVKYRQGLPMNIWQNMGLVYSDQESKERTEIEIKIKSLIMSLVHHLPIDEAVDRMAIRYQHDALPPLLSPEEKSQMVYGGSIKETLQMTAATAVRLTRANILRLLRYDDELRVYFYVDNSKEYHQYEENYLQISADDAPAIELLIKTYPDYITVNNLQLANMERNIDVAQDLWERGLLMVNNVK